MNPRFSFLSIIFLIWLNNNSFGQNIYTLPQLTPQSPNTASLGKYGDVPVSLSNGMANVSIPLFNLKVGSFGLPITLSYHNNGLQNDELASWVGLGWDIQAGGIISVEQRGNYDFDQDGVGMFTTNTVNPNSVAALNKFLAGQMSAQEQYDYEESVMRGDMDSEYDLFHYSFNGRSGSFYFDGNQNIVCVPKTDLKITHTIDGFQIIDEKGNTYYFQATEASQMGPPEGTVAPRKSFHNTAAFLLAGILTAENRSIAFTYQPYPMTYSRLSYSLGSSDFQPWAQCPHNSLGASTMVYTLNNNLLYAISFDEGTVYFDVSDDMRQDFKNINSNINVPYLKKVRLVDNTNNVREAYTFNSSYFAFNSARLRLAGITRNNGTAPAETWSFDYYSPDLVPLYFDAGKDHWGYFNGAKGVGTMDVPIADYSTITGIPWANVNGNIDKTADFSKSISGVLQRITYPTGGATDFTYESNEIQFLHASELTASPFLATNPLQYGHTVDIVNDNTDANATASGTFTLTGPTPVAVQARYAYDPSNFTTSAIYVNPSSNPFALPSLLDQLSSQPYSCADGFCVLQTTIQLPAGSYSYNLIRNTNVDFQDGRGAASLTMSIFVSDEDNVITYPLGGCRIKEVVSSDGLGHTVTKKYEYTETSDKVVFRNIPYYISRNQTNVDVNAGDQGLLACQQCHPQYIASDESVVPLSGNPIQYEYVTEYTDENGDNGKVDYTFSTDVDYTGNSGAPYVPRWITTWRGGIQLDKKSYKKTESGYALVAEESAANEAITPSQNTGLRIEYGVYCAEQGLQYRQFNTNQEQFINETFHQLSSTQAMYDNSGNISSTNTDAYLSSAHTLPTQVSRINSRGEMVRQQIIYSMDYNAGTVADNASAGIKNLQNKNVLTPIETVTVKTINNTDYVIDGLLMTYKTSATVPDVVYRLKAAAPIPLSSFTLSSIGAGGLFIMDSRYEIRAELSAYDAFNNLLQAHYANNSYSSYLWDYHSLHLVCEAKNAVQQDIAYTSFESDGTGNWSVSGGSVDATQSISGRSSYQNGTISKSNLNPATTYIVSYWSQNGSYTIPGTISGYPVKGKTVSYHNPVWTLYVHKVSGQSTITVSVTGHIDELRLYPATAQMTTYTYDPLVGLTSQADAGNRITYFEYDDLARLKRVRDQDYNILKSYEYQYQGPIPAYAFYNLEQDSVFARDNCPSGGAPSSITYSVPAGTVGSNIGQDDANLQARVLMRAQGPVQADIVCTCTWQNVKQTGYFTRNNCGSGLISNPIYDSIPAGTYSSIISQVDADQQAINAAQAYANANSVCTSQMVDITCNDLINVTDVTAVFTNTSTGQQYTFNLFTGTVGSVPTGTYNVTLTSSNIYSMGFLCGFSSGGTSVTIFNVNIDANTCNQLYIDTTGQGT